MRIPCFLLSFFFVKESSKFINILREELCKHIYICRPSKTTLFKHGILRRLKNNKDIIICKPDKGNGVVIIDRSIYVQELDKILSDNSKFKKLNYDPTSTREGQLQRFLRKIKCKSLFSDQQYTEMYPSGSQLARLYGLPKIHKLKPNQQVPPFRPIVSSIGTYNYKLARYLCDILTPLVPDEHCTKGTFTFIE